MSISRLVAESAQKQAAKEAPKPFAEAIQEPLGDLPVSAGADTRSGPPPARTAAPASEEAAGGNPNKTIAAALDVLSKYIPSEVVAIYIFGLSILGVVSQSFKGFDVWTGLFILCFVLVVFFVVINWLALKKDGTAIKFPTWALVAGLISFAVWSFAIPGNPLIESDGAKMLAGFAAVVSSYVLAAIERVLP